MTRTHARTPLTLALALLLTACGGGSSGGGSSSGGGGDVKAPPLITPAPPKMAQFNAWYAGPTVFGKNYSPNTVLTEDADKHLVVNIPHIGNGETDAILMTRSVAGAKMLHVTYRVDTDNTIDPKEYPQYTVASITWFFQRANDNWSCTGKYDGYRWYATKYSQLLQGGTYTMDVPFTDGWTGCQSYTQTANPQAFADAKAQSVVVGLALGGGTGVMHGVVGLGTYARLTILDWSIN